MGSCRSVAAGRVVSSDSSRSFLVARPRSLGARHFSGAGVPSARIGVRLLGRGLGGSLRRTGRFRPLGSRRGRALDHCPRALGNRKSSPVVCSTSRRFLGGDLRRQLDRRFLSEEPRQDSLFLSELHRSEDSPLGRPVVISPQFIMGKHNVLVDALSRPNQILGSEWTLKQEVFRDLCKRWPVSIDLFATSQNHRCSIYFSPYHDRNALGTDALLQNWNGWQAYASPPWSLIPAVLKKLRSSSGVLLTIIAPYWPQRPWFPDLLDLVVDGPVALPQSRDLLRQPHFHWFQLGVSRLSLHAWRLSSDSPVPMDSPSM